MKHLQQCTIKLILSGTLLRQWKANTGFRKSSSSPRSLIVHSIVCTFQHKTFGVADLHKLFLHLPGLLGRLSRLMCAHLLTRGLARRRGLKPDGVCCCIGVSASLSTEIWSCRAIPSSASHLPCTSRGRFYGTGIVCGAHCFPLIEFITQFQTLCLLTSRHWGFPTGTV